MGRYGHSGVGSTQSLYPDDMLLVEMNDPLYTVVSLLAHISRLYPINGLLQKSHVNENEIIETDCLC